LDDKKVMSGSE